jgi:hypothetical protein
MDIANEVSEAIAQPLGMQFDEDELQAELEGLQQATLDEQLLDTQDVPVITDRNINDPTIPIPAHVKTNPEQETDLTDDDARELRELEESMAM